MPIITNDVTFPGTAGHTLAGRLAKPEGAGPFPAVVVIHEAYGLNDNIRELAARFANEGYMALAVDLFAGRSRSVCMAQFLSGMLFNSLGNIAIRDLKTSLDYLSALPDVDGARLGAIGFCMGGGFAIAWACTDKRLKAIAPYYAMNPRPLEAVARACPIVGSYPEQDFTGGAGRKLDHKLSELNVEHDIKIYDGAHHSFFNDQGKTYNAQVAADSWTRVLAFFGNHLKSMPSA